MAKLFLYVISFFFFYILTILTFDWYKHKLYLACNVFWKKFCVQRNEKGKNIFLFVNILFIKNKYQLFIIFGSGQIFTTSILYLYDVLFSKVTSPLFFSSLLRLTIFVFISRRRRRGSQQNLHMSVFIFMTT